MANHHRAALFSQTIEQNPNKALALKNLAALVRDDFALVDAFREAGACEWIVNTMREHCSDKRVAEHGCAAVLWMAFQNAPSSERLGKCGACEVVTRALQAFGKDNAVVARFGSNAIGNLTADVDENAARFGELEICPLLVELLRLHGARDPYVAENICYAIGNLVAVNEQNRKRLGADSGVCEAIVISLQAFAGFDPVVANFACNAIGNLALTCGTRLGECGACMIVVDCLKNFRDLATSHVAMSGCYAVGNLAFDSTANKNALREHGACEQVLLCLENAATEEDVIKNAYYAIKRLAFNNQANQDELNSHSAWQALARKMDTIKLSSAELNPQGLHLLFLGLQLPTSKVSSLELHAFVLDEQTAEELVAAITHKNNKLDQLELRNVQMPDQAWIRLFQSFESENNRITKLSTGNSRADVDFVNLQFLDYFIALQLGMQLPRSIPQRYPKDGKFEFAKCIAQLRVPAARDLVLRTNRRFAIRHHTFRTLVQDLIKLKCDSLFGFGFLETLSIAKLQIARELKCLVYVVTALEDGTKHGATARLANMIKTSKGAELVANKQRALLTKVLHEENLYLMRLTREIDALFEGAEIRFDDGLLNSLLTNIKLKISQVSLPALSKLAECLRQAKTHLRAAIYTLPHAQSLSELAQTVEAVNAQPEGEANGEDWIGKLTTALAPLLDEPAMHANVHEEEDPYFNVKMGIASNFAALQAGVRELVANQSRDLCTYLEAEAMLKHPPFDFLELVCGQIDKIEGALTSHVIAARAMESSNRQAAAAAKAAVVAEEDERIV